MKKNNDEDDELDSYKAKKKAQQEFTKSKVKKAISKKTLFSALESYFEKDLESAKQLSEYILNSREESVKESIRRKKDK